MKEEKTEEIPGQFKVVDKAKKFWKTVKPWLFTLRFKKTLEELFGDSALITNKQMATSWFFWTFLIAFILGAMVSCSTLEEEYNFSKEIIKAEGEALARGIGDTSRFVIASTVSHYGQKVRAELKRAKTNVTEKIREEVDNAAYKIGIDKTKPLSKAEKAEAKKKIIEIITMPEFQKIANPYLYEKPAEEGKYQYGSRGQWLPSQKLRDEFFKRNPKAKTARHELQILFMGLHELGFDFLAYEAYRSCERQLELYKKKATSIKTCTGTHNKNPSHAIDAVPLRAGKALWNDRVQYATMAGVAHQLYCSLASQHGWDAGYRWGGKWRFRTDRDVGENDRRFVDMPHHEVSERNPLDCLELEVNEPTIKDKKEADAAFEAAQNILEAR